MKDVIEALNELEYLSWNTDRDTGIPRYNLLTNIADRANYIDRVRAELLLFGPEILGDNADADVAFSIILGTAFTVDDEELAYEYFVQVLRKLQKELADKNNEEE